MITLLTPRFTPFFLITWIISNVSVAIYPLQALPHVYRYGYAFPFYNISRAVRAIVFRTKNEGAFLSFPFRFPPPSFFPYIFVAYNPNRYSF
jgi:hypothetical protein